KLSDAERAMLADIGHRLGRKVLAEVATVARPETILAGYGKLIARKFDGSKARRRPGRPRIKREVEELIVRTTRRLPTKQLLQLGGRGNRSVTPKIACRERVSVASAEQNQWPDPPARYMRELVQIPPS